MDTMKLLNLMVLLATTHTSAVPSVELRGLWLATVDNMDWPSSPHQSVQQQQEELLTYIQMMAALNMNCLFFQVRPAGDALYISDLEPWSVYLTGKQGIPPDPLWDPLAFLVEHGHSHGIQVHAWINPYRAKFHNPTTQGLDKHHITMRYPQFAYPYGEDLWMDPGAGVILDHLLRVADDILTRYAIDGLHIDDYFYPYPVGNLQFPDNRTYQAYIHEGGTLALDDWRRNNINLMIQDLESLVTSHGKTFSISPIGLYRPGQPGGMPSPITGLDPYASEYADTKLWLEKGWCDWFIPGTHWAIEIPQQSYSVILDWWLNVNSESSNKLVFAHVSLNNLVPPMDWDPLEVVAQVNVSRQASFRGRGSMGNVFFGAKFIINNVKNIHNVIKELYYNHATIPQRSKKYISTSTLYPY